MFVRYLQETPSTSGGQPRERAMCFYCDSPVSHFARHIVRNHPQECEVQEILSKPVSSKERKILIDTLRKKGNFIYNQNVCLKPVRKSAVENTEFSSCPYCLGFYSKKHLHRHKKHCPENRESKLSVGQNYCIRVLKIDQQLVTQVFPRMRADGVSLIAKQDKLICAFGAWYLKIHGGKHFINITSRKMRELAKILIEAKKMQPDIHDLLELLQPLHFHILIEATKRVAKYDSEKDVFLSPTFAMNIATSLKQCCNTALDLADENTQIKLKNLKRLLETKWKFDLCNQVDDKTKMTYCDKVFVNNKKRHHVRWTDEQKFLVKTFFKTHIANKKPPKRYECESLIEQNPDVLHNKCWLKIKVCVQNIYSGKLKRC